MATYQLSSNELLGHRHIHHGPLSEPGVSGGCAVADARIPWDEGFDLDPLTALHGAEGKLLPFILGF